MNERGNRYAKIEHQTIGEGRRMLQAFEQTGMYVFHGSPNGDIHLLEPRQPYDWSQGTKQPHGDPCISATPYADIALFRAVVYTDTTSFGMEDEGKLVFKATNQALRDAKTHVGYVYVLNRKDFQPYLGQEQSMEWRAHEHQIPHTRIQVTIDDLPNGIEIIPSKNE